VPRPDQLDAAVGGQDSGLAEPLVVFDRQSMPRWFEGRVRITFAASLPRGGFAVRAYPVARRTSARVAKRMRCDNGKRRNVDAAVPAVNAVRFE